MMDLNDFYFRHQISLMRAGGAGSAEIRARHLAHADELAHDIRQWQQTVGAGVTLGGDRGLTAGPCS